MSNLDDLASSPERVFHTEARSELVEIAASKPRSQTLAVSALIVMVAGPATLVSMTFYWAFLGPFPTPTLWSTVLLMGLMLVPVLLGTVYRSTWILNPGSTPRSNLFYYVFCGVAAVAAFALPAALVNALLPKFLFLFILHSIYRYSPALGALVSLANLRSFLFSEKFISHTRNLSPKSRITKLNELNTKAHLQEGDWYVQ